MRSLVKNILATFVLSLMVPLSSFSQSREEFREAHFIQQGDTLRYRILFPEDLSKAYPVVLFLHGAGERGDDNASQLTHGADLFLKEEVRRQYPAIVIFPQVPKDGYWAQVTVNREVRPFQFDFHSDSIPTRSLELVMSLMDTIAKQAYVDPERIYVGGLSMGGMGTFEILGRKPNMFAAAFAICGGADPRIVKNYPKNFPIWIFHGEKDDIVPPSFSKTMARTINTHGGNAKLSLYPNDNHNSWDSALTEPYLLSWLFSNNKN